jgi:hypothetical protein
MRRSLDVCLQVGVLTKDTHRSTIRLAPPLIINEPQVDWAVDRLTEVLEEAASSPVQAEHEEEASRPEQDPRSGNRLSEKIIRSPYRRETHRSVRKGRPDAPTNAVPCASTRTVSRKRSVEFFRAT